MAAPRPIAGFPRVPPAAARLPAVAALLALGGCLGSRGPLVLAPGSDMVRAEPVLEGAARRAIQGCDGSTQAGVADGVRAQGRCSRSRVDTVRAAPDTVERVQRVP